MKLPAALALFVALAASALAQTGTSASSAAPANVMPPARGARQFREPTWLMPPVEGPGLHFKTFESRTAGERVSYLLYLPPDYEAEKDRRYPVVYWLHGIGGAQTGVPAMAARHNQAIAEKKTPPMIVVYVNGMIRSGYVDGQFAVETVTIKELIPHIDATCRTVATREGRIVEGFSMGGSGAAYWGFKYPDMFGAVSILAGALRDPSNPGRGGDATADPAREQARRANGWELVRQNADRIRGRTVIRVVVGERDGLKEANTKFHELLDTLGLDHGFHVIPDAPHSPNPLYAGLGDKNWTFYRAALERVIGSSAKIN
jgi:endo-1,4-beta-xylanase